VWIFLDEFGNDFSELDNLISLVLEGLLNYPAWNASLEVELGRVGTESLIGVAIVRLQLPAAHLSKIIIDNSLLTATEALTTPLFSGMRSGLPESKAST
jgi:hypothetical protein